MKKQCVICRGMKTFMQNRRNAVVSWPLRRAQNDSTLFGNSLVDGVSAYIVVVHESFQWVCSVDSAIGTLRTLVTAEQIFPKKHPARGYSCALSDLDSDAMLRAIAKSSNRNGYAFDLFCPAKDRDGIQKAYKVTARPLHTDMPAYCSDQTGVLRYDEKGSTSDCLQNGIPF